MADISQELSAIKNSVYGKNMRTAIHDAIKKVNEDGGGGGGGGSVTITTLWSNESGSDVGIEYTMSDDINNYDIIYLKISTNTDLSLRNSYASTIFLPQFYNTDELVSWQGFYQRVIEARFNGNKFIQTMSNAGNEDSGYAPKVYQIVGIKF